MVNQIKTLQEELHEKTLRELGLIQDKNGKVRKFPVNSHRSPSTPVTPFRIPVIEKTTRQAQSTQGYKASAHWQTAMLLHDLIILWTPTLPYSEKRKREQIESAIWSVVSTIEEGWARPSTKEYLDFIGFSQASLAEVRGGAERFASRGFLKTGNKGNKRETTGAMYLAEIPTPSRNFPYPPVNSRKNPLKYGKLRDKLREYTRKEILPEDLTYEIFTELINKVDYLLKHTVFGLQNKVIREEKEKFSGRIKSYWKPPKK